MNQLLGEVFRITYYDEESHYTVAHVDTQEKKDVTIAGVIPFLQVGMCITCQGSYKMHPKHGIYFDVSQFSIELPKNLGAIEKFLGSGAFPGIGPGFAKKIVEIFKEETFTIIDQKPERLKEIQSLGALRAEKLHESWKTHKLQEQIWLFFHDRNITKTQAKKIIRRFGPNALDIIKKNPYILAKEVHGIGFIQADQIAQKMGLEKHSTERIRSGILHALIELEQDGHTAVPITLALARAHKLLDIPETHIQQEMGLLFQEGEIEMRRYPNESDFLVSSRILFLAEHGVSQEIQRLKVAQAAIRQVDIDKAIEWVQEKLQFTFAEKQKEALGLVLTEKMTIITGGPGTGKSTITRALVRIFEKLTNKILLCAPTGRAAKRLSDVTHRHASTIHRVLKFDPQKGSFTYTKENPLDCDLIIIDEVSMIDTYLMYQLLKALPQSAKVVFVGDKDQLPSVGAGKVLADLIQTNIIPTATLSTIFRQAKGSRIIYNAHRINEGKIPYLADPDGDFAFIYENDAELIRKKTLELVLDILPKKYGFDPIKDIQVLVPMKKGACGIDQLNINLQEAIIEKSASRYMRFAVGDKVMQIRNNYSRDVFNGDIGVISDINHEEEKIKVKMDERDVEYAFCDLDELVLAYAISVHKFQGSESPCVVIPIHTSHFTLLSKNLLYTAVTRGKKKVVLVGSKKAVAIAVNAQEKHVRSTALRHHLESTFTNFLNV